MCVGVWVCVHVFRNEEEDDWKQESKDFLWMILFWRGVVRGRGGRFCMWVDGWVGVYSMSGGACARLLLVMEEEEEMERREEELKT